MKKYTQYIPITAFAAAVALSGSVHAQNKAPEVTSMKDRQGESQMPAHNGDKSQTKSMSTKANSQRMKASELNGMSVENSQGESVGNIDEVFLDLETSKVVGVVVSTGGFLGMGDRKTLLGLQEMSVDPKNEKIILDYSRDQIKELTEYKENDPSVFDGLGARAAGSAPRSQPEQSSMDTRTGARKVSPTLEGTSDMTVFDQGNSSEEIDMTASIRTAIGDNDKLSHKANNVTIITNNGKVVLRGEVDSNQEKTTLENIARNKAGRENVTSELTVAGL